MEKENLDTKLLKKLRKLAEKGKYKKYLKVINKALGKVKVEDCGEKMLFLPDCLRNDIFIKLVDLKISIKDEERLFLREGIVERLNKAQDLLPRGYHLLIRDVFRSEDVVWKIYKIYLEEFKEREPGLSDKEVDLKVRNFVAMPDDPVPPGHMTGGAIDIVLADDKKEKMNLNVDESIISREEQLFTFHPKLPKDILEKRKILYDAMTGVGFRNYFREYWHYSYGDPYWAVYRKEKTAIYGVPSRELFGKIPNLPADRHGS